MRHLEAQARRDPLPVANDTGFTGQHELRCIRLPGRPGIEAAAGQRRLGLGREKEAEGYVALGQIGVFQGGKHQLMADRAAAGADALALEIGKGLDGRVRAHQNGKAALLCPRGQDGPDRSPRGDREGEGRIADDAGIDGLGVEGLQQRSRGRELAPFDLVGQILEHAGGLHQGAGAAALIADLEDRLGPGGRPRQGERGSGRQKGDTLHDSAPLLGRHGALVGSLGEQAAEGGDQLASVLNRVLQGIEAPDEEGRDPEIVVVEQGIGDLIGRADKGRRVPCAPVSCGNGGVEALVEPIALGGCGEQPACPFDWAAVQQRPAPLPPAPL